MHSHAIHYWGTYTMKIHRTTFLALALALPIGYAAGLASPSGRPEFATSINQGLVTAFGSVGRNLFGTHAFGATTLYESGPNGDAPVAVQMDIVCQPPPADDTLTAIPRIVNIVYPPDPVFPQGDCRIGLQLLIDEDGVTAIVDTEIASFETIAGSPVGVSFCEADASEDDFTDQ